MCFSKARDTSKTQTHQIQISQSSVPFPKNATCEFILEFTSFGVLTLSSEAMDPSKHFDPLISLCLQMMNFNLQESNTLKCLFEMEFTHMTFTY